MEKSIHLYPFYEAVGAVRHDNTCLTPAENIRNIASNKVLSDINAGIHKAAENGEMHFDYPLGM